MTPASRKGQEGVHVVYDLLRANHYSQKLGINIRRTVPHGAEMICKIRIINLSQAFVTHLN